MGELSTPGPPAAPSARRPMLKSPRVIVPALVLAVLGAGLLAGRLIFAGHAWDPAPLRSYLPPDARDVRTGGSTTFLTTEGACSFSAQPAELDKLAASPGFADITDEVAAPAGHWWRAELDRVARRHIGQSLDSFGKARFYQRTLRDQGDASEDVALVVNATRDNAVLLYLYQQ